jgi:hypothetical protein
VLVFAAFQRFLGVPEGTILQRQTKLIQLEEQVRYSYMDRKKLCPYSAPDKHVVADGYIVCPCHGHVFRNVYVDK